MYRKYSAASKARQWICQEVYKMHGYALFGTELKNYISTAIFDIAYIRQDCITELEKMLYHSALTTCTVKCTFSMNVKKIYIQPRVLIFTCWCTIWQGGHGTGKTGNLVLTFSGQEKHREFCCNTGKVFETQGKYFWLYLLVQKACFSLHIFKMF